MVELVATTTGLYPLPDRAKERLADLKGHQKEDLIDGTEGAEIGRVYDEARKTVLDWQREADLDLIVEGQCRWDDMLAHPLAVHDAVETRGIVRYYNNNNFYREPVVTGELTPSGDVAAELTAASEHVPSGLQAVLPGPYTLADLATDEHYDDDEEFLAAVTEFLATEIESFPDHDALFLLEPSLVTAPPESGADERVSAAIDEVAAATDADVVVHTYWGALDERVHAHLLDARIDAVGYDLVNAHDEARALVSEYGTADDVALGLVDARNTAVESPETIRERVEWFQQGLPVQEFGAVYLLPNAETFYLPINRFRAKLAALGEAATTTEVRA